MRKTLLIIISIAGMGFFNSVFSQKTSVSKEPLELSEKEKSKLSFFFNNHDFMLGYKYEYHNRVLEARPWYLKAAEQFVDSEEWKGYDEVQGRLVKSYIGYDDFQKGIDAGKKALKVIAEKCKKKESYTLDIYRGMGVLYDEHHQPDSAMMMFRKLLEKTFEIYRIDTTYKIGTVYNSIGVVHKNMGEIDSAYFYFKKAEDSFLTATDCDNCRKSMLMDVYNNLGFVNQTKGNYEAAILNQKKAYELSQDRGSRYHLLQEVEMLMKMGNIYAEIQEYESAAEHYNQAIFQIKESKTEEAKYSVKFLSELNILSGNIAYQQKEYEKALRFLDTAAVILGDSEIFLSQKISMLLEKGKIQSALENYDLALSFLNRADSLSLSHIENSGDQSLNYELRNEINFELAFIASKSGNYALACQKYDSLLFELKEKGQKRGKSFIKTNFELANIKMEEGLTDEAFYHNQAAIEGSLKPNVVTEENKMPGIESFQSLVNVYEVLLQKARLFEKKNEYQNALETVEIAANLHDRNLKKTGILRAGRSKNLCLGAYPIYSKGVELSRKIGGENEAESSYYFTQKMKSRQLLLSVLDSEAKAFGGLDETILNDEKNLLSEIDYYESELLRLKDDSEERKRIENNKLFRLREDYQRLLLKLETDYPEYFEMKYRLSVTNPKTIQEQINDDEIVIEYAFSEGNLLNIYTLTKNEQIEIATVTHPEGLFDDIKTFNKLLQKSSLTRKTNREKFIRLSNELYNQFLQPAASRLKGKKRLIIIGDGVTNYIPFEVLLDSDLKKPFAELNFLVKDFEVSYHYSSTLFAKSRKAIQKEKANLSSDLYAFAPVYEKNEIGTPAFMTGEEIVYRDTTLRAVDAEGNFSPLPESEKEVSSIITLFEKNGSEKSRLDLRAEATELSLKENLEKAYKFIHIAGHSFADLKNPKFSGIACFEKTDSSKTFSDDILYTGEIYNVNINADLVTLSSCESGFGKLEKAEGLLGLNRAFIYSGAPNVVFSLWKVYDKISAEMMIDFYKEILSGETYSSALRTAKLNLINKEATAAPNFWSPFLLIGR